MTVTYQVAGGGHLDIDFWVHPRSAHSSSDARLLPRTDPLGTPIQFRESSFQLKGPDNQVMVEQKKMDTGTYSFTAVTDGRYTYCFSNEMSTVTGKTVR